MRVSTERKVLKVRGGEEGGDEDGMR